MISTYGHALKPGARIALTSRHRKPLHLILLLTKKLTTRLQQQTSNQQLLESPTLLHKSRISNFYSIFISYTSVPL